MYSNVSILLFSPPLLSSPPSLPFSYAVLEAMGGVLKAAGAKVTARVRPTLDQVLIHDVCLVEDLDDDKSRKLAAAAYGAFTGNLPGDDVRSIILDTVLGGADGK